MEAQIKIEINGEVDTLNNWAKKYQVPRISAYRRYKRGKTGADIFKVRTQSKPNTVGQYATKADDFVEMVQLNIAMPRWQVDALERMAKLSGIKRTKLAHKILAKYLQDTAETKARVDSM